LLDSKTVRAIADEMRLAVEALWPELAHKLPPKEVAGPVSKGFGWQEQEEE
jgi:hypothetical protein